MKTALFKDTGWVLKWCVAGLILGGLLFGGCSGGFSSPSNNAAEMSVPLFDDREDDSLSGRGIATQYEISRP